MSIPDDQPVELAKSSRLERRDWLFMAVLAIVAFVVFLPSLHYEVTNWDDDEYILYNPWIWNLSWENVRGVFVHPYFSNYHPLTMLVYMVVFSCFGDAPEPYRLVNFFLHSGTVVLLFTLLRSMGSRRDVAALLAAFFAVHPLRVESVVWISELKDVLCGFFYVLALLLWVWGSQRKSSVNRFHALAMVPATLALLAKSMAVTLPVALLLHDFILDRPRLMRRLPVLAMLILLSIGCMKMNLSTQDSAINRQMTRSGAVAMAVYAPVHYLNKTLLPIGLCPIYAVEERPSQHASGVVAGVLVCGIALVAVAMNFRKRPMVAFALLASAVSLAPVSMIIPIGSAWAADRYSYIPTALLLCGVAALTSEYLNKKVSFTRPVHMVGVVVVAMMAIATLKYMPVWRNSATVAGRILLYFPEQGSGMINSRRAEIVEKYSQPQVLAATNSPPSKLLVELWSRMKYGDGIVAMELIEKGRVDEALEVLHSMPFPAAGLHLAAVHEEELGRHEEAVRDARAVIALGEAGGATPTEMVQAADVLTRNGMLEEAAVVIDSFDVPVHGAEVACGRLATEYVAQGDVNRAEKYARRGLRVFPAEDASLRVLVKVLNERGESEEAERILRQALRHSMISDETRDFANKTAKDK